MKNLVRDKTAVPAGLSLVETLIAIGLLGIVLIPMLFLSSAYFLSQLTRTRESIDATHGAATFLNRFFEEAALSQRILVGSGSGTGKSDSDAIYLAYYEPVTQKSYRVGYRLTSVTGGRKLERLEYNMVTQTWDVVSPYNHIKPSEVLLASTVQFQYCADSACSSPLTGTNVQNALLVRLHDTGASGDGWTFTKGRQTFKLLQDTAVVLSTSIPAGSMILSDQPKEMYTIDLTQAAAASPTETLVNLNPVGEQFNYLTSASSGGGGILSTINLSALVEPGSTRGMAVDSTGRLFFGDWDYWNSFWTWKDNILSTIGSAMTGPHDMVVDSSDRVYIGAEASSSAFYSWKTNTLSTLSTSNEEGPGSWSLLTAPNNRVYFGHWSTSTNYPVTTWLNGVLATSGVTGRTLGYGAIAVNPSTNGVYFGSCPSSGTYRLYYWNPATPVLTTIMSVTTSSPPYADSDGDCFRYRLKTTYSGLLYFSDDQNFYAWQPTTGVLSTIITGKAQPGKGAMAVVPLSDQVYFSEWGASSVYSYVPSNKLSTIAIPYADPTWASFVTLSDGRLVFGGIPGSAPYNGKIFSWKQGVGLSTITTTAIDSIGENAILADTNTNNVYFGQNTYAVSSATPGLFWVWNSTTNVLSTIIGTQPAADAVFGSTINDLGSPTVYGAAAIASDGRIFFGGGGSNPFYTWKNNVLSTICPSNVPNNGLASVQVASTGRVFFGSDDKMRTWAPGGSSYSLSRYTNTGLKTYQTLSISSSGSHTYAFSLQDLAGDLYLLDTANNNLDRYTYSASTLQYGYVSSLPIASGWIGNVGAMAADQASTGIAFLDSTNGRIYTYADRQATSGSATQYNLSGLSTVPATPTGMAINQRTGEYLILDSAIQSSGTSAYVRLFVLNSSVNTVRQIIPIKVNDTQYLSTDLRSETNFKIQYDERRNILYLMAPSVHKTYALSLPIYL